jgi:two-component system CheB/CheR fusion protein
MAKTPPVTKSKLVKSTSSGKSTPLPTRPPRPDTPASAPVPVAKKTFPIIGIGASAGGLEALELFLHHVPQNSGMAFVIVQHLDPTQKDLLPELLQRATRMPVQQVKDRTRVEPDQVYVIPPNNDMSILHGVLHLLPPVAPRGLRLPIDSFFRSLADDIPEGAIGVILSGMGSDGTLGIRAIKEKTGAVFVQAPTSAKFSGMPQSAIDAGLADVIAPVEELPGRIVAYLKHTPLLVLPDMPMDDQAQGVLDKIVLMLRNQTGHDFSLYKKNTIYRRIERRMGLHQIPKITDYVRYLQANPQEAELLFKELLIGVTSFFRDPAAWVQVQAEIMANLLANRPDGAVLRAWTPGCSTGEEAYSLAIVFKEAMDQLKPPRHLTLLIFATDLDKDAVEKARLGVYPANFTADISEARLQRFFVPDEHGYRVCKQIREMVIFAPQNLVMDPPFTKLDMITCRNLLIYLTPELQKKIFPLFHYSLNPGGFLFLGSAETIGNSTDLFAPLDGKLRLYRRLDHAARERLAVFPDTFSRAMHELGATGTAGKAAKPVTNMQVLVDNLILQRYAPAGVLTTAAGDIIYISGRTGKYLEPAAGKANWNIFAMAREGLRYTLNEASQNAQRQPTAVTLKGLKVGTNGGTQYVDITVQLQTEPEALRGTVLFVFTEVAGPITAKMPGQKLSNRASNTRITQLDLELRQAKSNVQTIREEMQTAQEELKSSNEELQSTNEELQSTNEELTTSKEEMQSMNEELHTVNHELQANVDELSCASNDMKNLLNSTDIAILFLDDTLRVRRFTTSTSKIIKLIPGDVGRPITDIVTTLVYPEMTEDIHAVLRTLLFTEKSVVDQSGHSYLIRIMAYRTHENKIDGVVITFTDVSVAKKLEAALRESGQRMNTILESISEAYFSVDDQLNITYINPAAERIFNRKLTAVLGKPLVKEFPEIHGTVLEQKCQAAVIAKIPVTFAANCATATGAKWYNVCVYPQSEGLSVFLHVRTEPTIP